MLRQVDHRADLYTQIRQFILLHGGRVKTYEDVAAFFQANLCPSPQMGCSVVQKDHDRGVATYDNVVHWTPRKMTRPGLRKFLKVIARIRVHNYVVMNKAMRIYAENAWTIHAATQLHIRFPTRYSTADRANIRWLMSTGMEVTPVASRWANRTQENTK